MHFAARRLRHQTKTRPAGKAMEGKKVKAIIFDLDNTLIETGRAGDVALQKVSRLGFVSLLQLLVNTFSEDGCVCVRTRMRTRVATKKVVPLKKMICFMIISGPLQLL